LGQAKEKKGEMVMECDHNKRWTITEYGMSFTEHTYDEGSLDHHTALDNYTGRCYFTCHDCDMSRRFNRTNKRLPGWLKAKIAVALVNH
jgi:hypothetical protein